MKKYFVTTVAIMMLLSSVAWGNECTYITKDEIAAAQKKWGEGIVAIGKAEDHRAVAIKHIDTLYGYDIGSVLFKPTKAVKDQFRGNKDEALSYFVAGIVPEDKGFALVPFIKVRFENEGTIINCDSAMAMGNYYFTTAEAKEIKVEYSFGYVKDDHGNLKINLHHSSLPYDKE